jgi:hypothetical protein
VEKNTAAIKRLKFGTVILFWLYVFHVFQLKKILKLQKSQSKVHIFFNFFNFFSVSVFLCFKLFVLELERKCTGFDKAKVRIRGV